MEKSRKKKTALQAGVVAFRQVAPHWPVQVCLITNRSGRWGFPKGTVRRSEAAPAAALREAYEEAGIAGDIVSGPFAFQRVRRQGKAFHLQMYLMQVTSVAAEWAEADRRQRQWASIPSAYEVIDRPVLHDILDYAMLRMRLLVPKADISRKAE